MIYRRALNKRDYYYYHHTGDLTPPRRVVSSSSFEADSDAESSTWNQVLVDEIDLLHAAEQGTRVMNRTECRVAHLNDGLYNSLQIYA